MNVIRHIHREKNQWNSCLCNCQSKLQRKKILNNDSCSQRSLILRKPKEFWGYGLTNQIYNKKLNSKLIPWIKIKWFRVCETVKNINTEILKTEQSIFKVHTENWSLHWENWKRSFWNWFAPPPHFFFSFGF